MINRARAHGLPIDPAWLSPNDVSAQKPPATHSPEPVTPIPASADVANDGKSQRAYIRVVIKQNPHCHLLAAYPIYF